MHTLSPRSTSESDLWEGILVQDLQQEDQSIAIDHLPTFIGDQLAHMADLVYENTYGCPCCCRLFISNRESGLAHLIDFECSHSVIHTPIFDSTTSDIHAPAQINQLSTRQGHCSK
ncbi:unnamed protein product [Hymenolepis diminuta]|uniref:Uncharacterized protein n=1 Tax=Hymenolepis diminuta TaxID=6216 RepID=A0A564XZU0_HYMDI|nr:unnamed protein product [Hymenolepis diminuta]